MKKIFKISYLYFATGLILCLYSLVSQANQVLNVDDTYYVISGNDFAIFVFIIYLFLGVIFLVIEKFISSNVKKFQFLMFTIPFIYFVFSDLSDDDKPGFYLTNPIVYQWNTIYIPFGLIFCFLISIICFFSLFGFAFWKWKKTASQ